MVKLKYSSRKRVKIYDVVTIVNPHVNLKYGDWIFTIKEIHDDYAMVLPIRVKTDSSKNPNSYEVMKLQSLSAYWLDRFGIKISPKDYKYIEFLYY